MPIHSLAGGDVGGGGKWGGNGKITRACHLIRSGGMGFDTDFKIILNARLFLIIRAKDRGES